MEELICRGLHWNTTQRNLQHYQAQLNPSMAGKVVPPKEYKTKEISYQDVHVLRFLCQLKHPLLTRCCLKMANLNHQPDWNLGFMHNGQIYPQNQIYVAPQPKPSISNLDTKVDTTPNTPTQYRSKERKLIPWSPPTSPREPQCGGP